MISCSTSICGTIFSLRFRRPACMPIDPAQAVALLASIQWSRDLEKMSKTLAARFEREMKEVPLPLPCCGFAVGWHKRWLGADDAETDEAGRNSGCASHRCQQEAREARGTIGVSFERHPTRKGADVGPRFCRSVLARQTLHPIHSHLEGQSGVCRGFQQSPGEVREENDRNGAGTAPPGRDATSCHA